MPSLRPDAPRRVGLLSRLQSDETARGQPPPTRDGPPSDHPVLDGGVDGGVAGLLAIAEALAVAIRDGEFQTDPEEGILLDLTVGSVRCLVLEQHESVAVALSPREQQIALMVAAGRTNQAIAGSLEISAWTVSTHLRRIYAKLAVSSRAEMVAHLLAHADYAYLVDPTGARPGPR